MSFARIQIIGNCGRDPEMRYTPQGDAVASVSVAVSKKKKDNTGEMTENTTWYKVTAWRKQAEFLTKYFTKGASIAVYGELSMENWTDRDGNARTSLEINAQNIDFTGAKNESQPQNSPFASDYSGLPQAAPAPAPTASDDEW